MRANNIKIRIFSIIVVVIVMLSAIYAVTVGWLVFNAKKDEEWMSQLQTNGPWGEDAVWKSAEADIYLVCTPKDMGSNNTIEVTAYVLCDNQWLPTRFNVRDGIENVFFDTFDGETILQGKAQLVEGDLVITGLTDNQFDVIRGRTEIIISKFPYRDLLNNLPFDIENSMILAPS